MQEPARTTAREAVHCGADPNSGASIVQLTSAPAIHSNIYCEVPYFDPSSRWLIYVTRQTSYGPAEVWRADLEQFWLTPVSDGAHYIYGVAMSPDQRYFYCTRDAGEDSFEVLRTEIATLKQKFVVLEGAPHLHVRDRVRGV